MQQFNFIKIANAAGEIGEVTAPSWLSKWTRTTDTDGGQAIFRLIGTVIVIATTIAGIFFVIQLITAGYLYISSNGDPKKVDMAGQKILQSLIGIIVVASAMTLGTVIGRIIGINITNFSF
jgi:hypothetical protein